MTQSAKIRKIKCKNKKNGGGDSNLRYKTYTDKIWQVRGKHQENGGWFYSQIQRITDKYIIGNPAVKRFDLKIQDLYW